MTGIHYDDLKQVHTVFGLLDKDTQERLRACNRVECYISGRWVRNDHPAFQEDIVYRQAPDLDRTIDVNWHALGPVVYCVARDEDGKVYAYNHDPEEGEHVWRGRVGDGEGAYWQLNGLALLRDPGEGDWRKSKVINPLWQGGKE